MRYSLMADGRASSYSSRMNSRSEGQSSGWWHLLPFCYPTNRGRKKASTGCYGIAGSTLQEEVDTHHPHHQHLRRTRRRRHILSSLSSLGALQGQQPAKRKRTQRQNESKDIIFHPADFSIRYSIKAEQRALSDGKGWRNLHLSLHPWQLGNV